MAFFTYREGQLYAESIPLDGGRHRHTPVKELRPYQIVGPICETGDTFARDRQLPPMQAGDLIAIRDAGAYGAVMSSSYNTRPLVPEVLVEGDDFTVIRKRPGIDELISLDSPVDLSQLYKPDIFRDVRTIGVTVNQVTK